MQANMKNTVDQAVESVRAVDLKLDVFQATMTAKHDNMQQVTLNALILYEWILTPCSKFKH